jgi:hypothetical protein
MIKLTKSNDKNYFLLYNIKVKMSKTKKQSSKINSKRVYGYPRKNLNRLYKENMLADKLT